MIEKADLRPLRQLWRCIPRHSPCMAIEWVYDLTAYRLSYMMRYSLQSISVHQLCELSSRCTTIATAPRYTSSTSR